MKIEYQSVKDNRDYIMCNLKLQLNLLLIETLDNIPDYIKKEIRNMNEKAIEYEQETGNSVSNIVFRKDSILGQFIEQNEYDMFQNMDLKINYNKVIGALKRAADLDDLNLINRYLLPLFMSATTEELQELLESSSESAKQFILESDGITEYIDKLDRRGNSYLVYEDGRLEKGIFNGDLPKKKVKKAE